jgi:hypothetical protein
MKALRNTLVAFLTIGSVALAATNTLARLGGSDSDAVTLAGNRPAAQSSQPNMAVQYGGQKTCPVTDEKLGKMGPPVQVTIKGQTIFVCCRGCVKTVQGDPDQYLAKVLRERGGR